MMKNVNITIIHYDELKDRKKFFLEQIKKIKLKSNFFIQKKNNPYKKDEIKKYYIFNNQTWKDKCKLIKINVFPRQLTLNEISLGINHFKIIEKISKKNEKYGIIMEDDIILPNDFKNKLKKIKEELNKKEFNICFLDRGSKQIKKTSKKIKLISIKENFPWGTGAYIITKKTAQDIIKHFNKFTLPIDEEIKYLSKKNNYNILWVDPPVAKQGSICNKFKSSLDARDNTGLKKYFNIRFKLFKILYKHKLGILADNIEKLIGLIKRRL